MPNIAASDTCPLPLGAITITGQNQTDETCPLVASQRPKPISCATKLDTETADQISAAMVTKSECKNVTWPNGTGIGGQCDPSKKDKKSESSLLLSDLRTVIFPIFLFGFIFCLGW
jgi:hypothetical protein